jgi:pimeloyl-ACP methyl ester carboxylesterase
MASSAVALLPAGVCTAQDRISASGEGELSALLPGATLPVSTYRPAKCSPALLLVVFHGTDRNAGPYRDRVRPLAEKLCAVVISPKFDEGRFPRDAYQYGGVADHGRVIPAGARSVDLVAPLVAWAQEAVGRPGMPYVLIGHSAGGQFLSRVAAYTATGAARIVIANPSTWVMPSITTSMPFGFGGIKPAQDAELALRAYLARPVVVDLGGVDTGSTELDVTVDGMAQGPNRRARGRNAFNSAKAAAESHGWPFNWTLVEVPGVGHSSTKMFNAAETVAALQALGQRPR